MDELSPVFERVSQYFSLLAEPMRLRILHSICQQERPVGEIVESTGSTQTNVSRHLNAMYRAGVLSRRKEGTFVYYGVADQVLVDICRNVCVHVAGGLEQTGFDQASFAGIARNLTPGADAGANAGQVVGQS